MTLMEAFWVGSFTRIRARENCPEFDKLEGKTGRLIMLKSTPALEDFVSTHKRNEPDNDCELSRTIKTNAVRAGPQESSA